MICTQISKQMRKRICRVVLTSRHQQIVKAYAAIYDDALRQASQQQAEVDEEAAGSTKTSVQTTIQVAIAKVREETQKSAQLKEVEHEAEEQLMQHDNTPVEDVVAKIAAEEQIAAKLWEDEAERVRQETQDGETSEKMKLEEERRALEETLARKEIDKMERAAEEAQQTEEHVAAGDAALASVAARLEQGDVDGARAARATAAGEWAAAGMGMKTIKKSLAAVDVNITATLDKLQEQFQEAVAAETEAKRVVQEEDKLAHAAERLQINEEACKVETQEQAAAAAVVEEAEAGRIEEERRMVDVANAQEEEKTAAVAATFVEEDIERLRLVEEEHRAQCRQQVEQDREANERASLEEQARKKEEECDHMRVRLAEEVRKAQEEEEKAARLAQEERTAKEEEKSIALAKAAEEETERARLAEEARRAEEEEQQAAVVAAKAAEEEAERARLVDQECEAEEDRNRHAVEKRKQQAEHEMKQDIERERLEQEAEMLCNDEEVRKAEEEEHVAEAHARVARQAHSAAADTAMCLTKERVHEQDLESAYISRAVAAHEWECAGEDAGLWLQALDAQIAELATRLQQLREDGGEVSAEALRQHAEMHPTAQEEGGESLLFALGNSDVSTQSGAPNLPQWPSLSISEGGDSGAPISSDSEDDDEHAPPMLHDSMKESRLEQSVIMDDQDIFASCQDPAPPAPIATSLALANASTPSWAIGAMVGVDQLHVTPIKVGSICTLIADAHIDVGAGNVSGVVPGVSGRHVSVSHDSPSFSLDHDPLPVRFLLSVTVFLRFGYLGMYCFMVCFPIVI